jgi:hypothetical protein
MKKKINFSKGSKIKMTIKTIRVKIKIKNKLESNPKLLI